MKFLNTIFFLAITLTVLSTLNTHVQAITTTTTTSTDDDNVANPSDSENNNHTIYAPTLNIDGEYSGKDLTQERRDLEKDNNNLLQQKVEDMRMTEEKKITNKLQGVFEKLENQEVEVKPQTSVSEPTIKTANMTIVDSNQVVAPAPAPTITTAIITEKPLASAKITPTISGVIYSGEYENYEGKITPGLQIELPINHVFGLSFGIKYTMINITEIKRSTYNWYYSWTQQNYGTNYLSREIEGQNLSFEALTKLYIPTESKVRPYLAVGLGYDRMSLEYAQNNNMPTQYYNYYYSIPGSPSYGKEDYSSSFLSGVLNAGIEITLGKNIGMDLSGRYCKRLYQLNSQNGSYSSPSYYNQDQRLLNILGEDLSSANRLMITTGLIILF